MKSGDYLWLMKSSFSAAGRVNWIARGMDVLANFEGEEGVKGDVALKAKDNILEVKGRVDVGPAERVASEQGQDVSGDFLPGSMVDILQATNLKIGMDFDFVTKMDELKLKIIDFNGHGVFVF